MDETEQHEHLRFDWFGFIALAIGIGALQLMLDRGEQLGWFDSTEILIETIVSIAGFYYFFAHSLTTDEPFVRFEMFKDRNFVCRLRVHGGDRRGAVRHHGAGDAVHAAPARLSDPDRRLPARLARHRHAAHHDGRRPADEAARGAHLVFVGLALTGGTLYYFTGFSLDTTPEHHRRHQHHPGRRARPLVRAAEHRCILDAARTICAPAAQPS